MSEGPGGFGGNLAIGEAGAVGVDEGFAEIIRITQPIQGVVFLPDFFCAYRQRKEKKNGKWKIIHTFKRLVLTQVTRWDHRRLGHPWRTNH